MRRERIGVAGAAQIRVSLGRERRLSAASPQSSPVDGSNALVILRRDVDIHFMLQQHFHHLPETQSPVSCFDQKARRGLSKDGADIFCPVETSFRSPEKECVAVNFFGVKGIQGSEVRGVGVGVVWAARDVHVALEARVVEEVVAEVVHVLERLALHDGGLHVAVP